MLGSRGTRRCRVVASDDVAGAGSVDEVEPRGAARAVGTPRVGRKVAGLPKVEAKHSDRVGILLRLACAAAKFSNGPVFASRSPVFFLSPGSAVGHARSVNNPVVSPSKVTFELVGQPRPASHLAPTS